METWIECYLDYQEQCAAKSVKAIAKDTYEKKLRALAHAIYPTAWGNGSDTKYGPSCATNWAREGLVAIGINMPD